MSTIVAFSLGYPLSNTEEYYIHRIYKSGILNGGDENISREELPAIVQLLDPLLIRLNLFV